MNEVVARVCMREGVDRADVMEESESMDVSEYAGRATVTLGRVVVTAGLTPDFVSLRFPPLERSTLFSSTKGVVMLPAPLACPFVDCLSISKATLSCSLHVHSALVTPFTVASFGAGFLLLV